MALSWLSAAHLENACWQSREGIRDRIQNHALHDVSSKNYDRWNSMPEKRAGMEKLDKFVTALLSKGQNRKAA